MQQETMQLRLDVQQLSDQIAALELPTGQAVPIPTAAILSRELPRLPASTLEELEAAEAAIHDEAVATVLKEQLLRIGGRTLLETTANIMKDAICEKQAVDRTTALAVIGKWLPGSVDRGGGRKRRFAAMIAEPSLSRDKRRKRLHMQTGIYIKPSEKFLKNGSKACYVPFNALLQNLVKLPVTAKYLQQPCFPL
ncbi:uncharacterized protein LOC121836660 [Ixodes scapularis]|uniref:uncharacterized protein LOC121836660 n=1 Tax=Ixodes scapularis TaxID=6945 RepID=UPI001C38076B|nr:uncharacterized protein LOC121836660 [Ixodes scapularis]